MSNIEDLIVSRHSVRRYLDKSIEKNKINELNKMIKEVNSKSGLNIKFVLDDPSVFDKFILHYGRIKGAKNYFAMIGENGKKFYENIGYYGEQIVLKAQELGLNTCWVGGTYSKGSIKIALNPNEKLACVIAVGYGESNGIVRKSKSFDKVSVTTDVPAWYKKGVEYALLAPTAMNLQRFRFELLDKNKVVIKTSNDLMAKIDKGIVKYHLALGAGIDIF